VSIKLKNQTYVNIKYITICELKFIQNKTLLIKLNLKGKAIPVTGCEGPYGCETSKFPHFLDNRLTDGDEVVSPKCQLPFTPQEESWYSFLLEAELTPGPFKKLY
jgi:hypothetical protein